MNLGQNRSAGKIHYSWRPFRKLRNVFVRYVNWTFLTMIRSRQSINSAYFLCWLNRSDNDYYRSQRKRQICNVKSAFLFGFKSCDVFTYRNIMFVALCRWVTNLTERIKYSLGARLRTYTVCQTIRIYIDVLPYSAGQIIP